jgi:hypothetical protein
MFHLLQVPKLDGSICSACTKGSGCPSPHVALSSITMGQALAAVSSTSVGHQTMTNALLRITAEQAAFKP